MVWKAGVSLLSNRWGSSSGCGGMQYHFFVAILCTFFCCTVYSINKNLLYPYVHDCELEYLIINVISCIRILLSRNFFLQFVIQQGLLSVYL